MHLIGKMGFSLLKQCLSHCEGERNGSIKKGGGKSKRDTNPASLVFVPGQLTVNGL